MGTGFELRPTNKLWGCSVRQQLALDDEKGLYLCSKMSKMRGKSRGVHTVDSGCCHWALLWCHGPINGTPMKEGAHLITPMKWMPLPHLRYKSPGKFWLLGIPMSSTKKMYKWTHSKASLRFRTTLCVASAQVKGIGWTLVQGEIRNRTRKVLYWGPKIQCKCKFQRNYEWIGIFISYQADYVKVHPGSEDCLVLWYSTMLPPLGWSTMYTINSPHASVSGSNFNSYFLFCCFSCLLFFSLSWEKAAMDKSPSLLRSGVLSESSKRKTKKQLLPNLIICLLHSWLR